MVEAFSTVLLNQWAMTPLRGMNLSQQSPKAICIAGVYLIVHGSSKIIIIKKH